MVLPFLMFLSILLSVSAESVTLAIGELEPDRHFYFVAENAGTGHITGIISIVVVKIEIH